MLNPSMSELMNKVGNRYLLVNLAAQRARNLAEEADQTETPLPDKAVQMALEDIVSGDIVYCPGEKEEKKTIQLNLASTLGMLDIDFSDDEEMLLDEETEEEEHYDEFDDDKDE